MKITARAALVLVLLVGAFSFLCWAVIYFPRWFIPAPWLAFSALVPALIFGFFLGWRPTDPRIVWVLPQSWTKDSPIMRIGYVLFLTFVWWLVIAQSIPAALTTAFGNDQEVKNQVHAYYKSNRGCGYRLVLENLNPVFGGFCGAGNDPAEFKPGNSVTLTVKESVLGMYVTKIETKG
jgi:hypothetical protein